MPWLFLRANVRDVLTNSALHDDDPRLISALRAMAERIPAGATVEARSVVEHAVRKGWREEENWLNATFSKEVDTNGMFAMSVQSEDNCFFYAVCPRGEMEVALVKPIVHTVHGGAAL